MYTWWLWLTLSASWGTAEEARSPVPRIVVFRSRIEEQESKWTTSPPPAVTYTPSSEKWWQSKMLSVGSRAVPAPSAARRMTGAANVPWRRSR